MCAFDLWVDARAPRTVTSSLVVSAHLQIWFSGLWWIHGFTHSHSDSWSDIHGGEHSIPSSNFLNHYFQMSSRFLPACRFQSKHFCIRVGGFWCIAQSLSKEKPTCNYKWNYYRTFTATRWRPVDVLQIPQRRYNSFWLVLVFQHCLREAHTMQSTNPLPP